MGAVGSGNRPRALAALAAMSHAGRVVEPSGGAVAAHHARKYRVFNAMHQHQLEYRRAMA